MKPIKTTITPLPIVIKINSFKYFIQIGDFNYEKSPICILLVFLVFYHIPPPLLQIDKIL